MCRSSLRALYISKVLKFPKGPVYINVLKLLQSITVPKSFPGHCAYQCTEVPPRSLYTSMYWSSPQSTVYISVLKFPQGIVYISVLKFPPGHWIHQCTEVPPGHCIHQCTEVSPIGRTVRLLKPPQSPHCHLGVVDHAKKNSPHPWLHGKPSLIALIGPLRPYCSQSPLILLRCVMEI